MVIHLGANRAIGAEQILLCTDITQGWAADTEKMVRAMQEKHLVRRLSDAPKTLVLCRENGRVVCYLTGVGLRTLSARMRENRSFFSPPDGKGAAGNRTKRGAACRTNWIRRLRRPRK